MSRVRVRITEWQSPQGTAWGLECRHQGKWLRVTRDDTPSVPWLTQDLGELMANRIYVKARLEGASIEQARARSKNQIVINQHITYFKQHGVGK